MSAKIGCPLNYTLYSKFSYTTAVYTQIIKESVTVVFVFNMNSFIHRPNSVQFISWTVLHINATKINEQKQIIYVSSVR